MCKKEKAPLWLRSLPPSGDNRWPLAVASALMPPPAAMPAAPAPPAATSSASSVVATVTLRAEIHLFTSFPSDYHSVYTRGR